MFNLQIFYFIPHQIKNFETASNVHAFYKLGIWLLRLSINFEYEAVNWPLFTFLSVTKKIILAFLQKKVYFMYTKVVVLCLAKVVDI